MTNNPPKVKICRLNPEHDSDLPLPRYMTPQASGMDLCAAIKENQEIQVGSIMVIPTGIAIALPQGFEAQIRPRSGLAFKHGIGIINAPGTIDSDYRGEIKVILFNYSDKPFKVKNRDRIAQLVFSKVVRANFVRTKRLRRTARQSGGLGHTGL